MIHTITFFAVSCPENPAFFRKNRQIFENIPRKILHVLNILEKCCILEKSRKKLVKFGENSAKFSQNLRNFGEKQKKIQQFLTKILRLENGASPSRASRPCSSRPSRGPLRSSRLRRLPLCSRPLRALPAFGAPSGAFRFLSPPRPALNLFLCAGLCKMFRSQWPLG